jgi:hypothetical protein
MSVLAAQAVIPGSNRNRTKISLGNELNMESPE